MELPIIDLTSLDAQGGGSVELGRQLDRVCSDIGFFQVIGHGVAVELVNTMAVRARDFFAQPLEQKILVEQPTPRTIRGYIPLGRGALAYTRSNRTPPDFKESFSIGPPRNPDADIESANAIHYAPNLWPRRPVHFETICMAYYQAMETLSGRLLRLMTSALALPVRCLEQAIDAHVSVLGLAYYPAQRERPMPGQLRCGAHSDFGSVTVLWPEAGSTGLEVKSRDGRWIPITAGPEAFVVNIGDVLEHWSAGRWRSTLHRVVNPKAERATLDRISLGYFQHPNPNTPMSPLTAASSIDDEAAITFGDYLAGKFSSQIQP